MMRRDYGSEVKTAVLILGDQLCSSLSQQEKVNLITDLSSWADPFLLILLPSIGEQVWNSRSRQAIFSIYISTAETIVSCSLS